MPGSNLQAARYPLGDKARVNTAEHFCERWLAAQHLYGLRDLGYGVFFHAANLG